MAFELKQELRLTQSLVMTPQLQQAIKLLQLSRLELVEEVKQEIEENPMLECAEGTDTPEVAAEPEEKKPESTELDWQSYLEGASGDYSGKGSLNFSDRVEDSYIDTLSNASGGIKEHLLEQLKLSKLSGDDIELGFFIIGNIDDDGYLRVVDENDLDPAVCEDMALEEISRSTGAPIGDVERVLGAIQDFDPAGVCARSTRESLLLQAARLPVRDTVVEEILKDHLNALANKNYKLIASRLSVSFDEIIDAAKIIVTELNPMPGSGFGADESRAVIPDVYITKVDGKYVVNQNDNGLPRLKISPYYRKLLNAKGGIKGETKEYIQERFKSALWLIKSVHQRRRTIVRVVESIVRFQREFLDKGVQYLKPLTLKDVAEDIGMHESTVSRVTSNKYADTPRGILRLKYFFSNSMSGVDGTDVAVEYIKKKIKGLVEVENPRKPLSDMRIVEFLKGDGIVLSRRTVTKYREAMGILSSHKRKSYL